MLGFYNLFGKKPEQTRILVAMSGGVDSSVVAILLKRLGYDLVGCTLQLAAPSCGLGACCTGRDLMDVKKMCASEGFPHVLVKARDEFKERVINKTVDSYSKGLTPSPCVWCNSKVRFDFLKQAAEEHGCDGFVTGHYAYVYPSKTGFALHSGVDPTKDQSYFLSMLSKEMLSKVRFPLGNMHKTTVRQIARALNIHVASKRDSQDLCFVKDTYTQTLWNIKPDIFQTGYIKNTKNEIVGTHDGIVGYTIGQRKGLGVSSHEPLYVSDIKTEENEVIIGSYEDGACSAILLDNVNIMDEYKEGMFVEAKVRARSSTSMARVYNQGSLIEFTTPIYHAARGQICVFYSGRKVVGSGVISDFIRYERKLLQA